MIFDVFPKVNIFLKIVGRNLKGYHLLDSRFCIAKGALKDIIEIRESDKFTLRGNFNCLVEDNLIYKAIEVLKQYIKKEEHKILNSLHIEVQKGIPIGAGLGGGSADAGSVLYWLNHKYFHFEQEKILQIASKIGADVSFFVMQSYSANVYGIGDQVELYEEEVLEFEIFNPQIFCDTKKVYQSYDRERKQMLQNYTYKQFEKTKSRNILTTHCRLELNDLLNPALSIYPQLKSVESMLGKEWFFSGSGSSFFRLKSGSQER